MDALPGDPTGLLGLQQLQQQQLLASDIAATMGVFLAVCVTFGATAAFFFHRHRQAWASQAQECAASPRHSLERQRSRNSSGDLHHRLSVDSRRRSEVGGCGGGGEHSHPGSLHHSPGGSTRGELTAKLLLDNDRLCAAGGGAGGRPLSRRPSLIVPGSPTKDSPLTRRSSASGLDAHLPLSPLAPAPTTQTRMGVRSLSFCLPFGGGGGGAAAAGAGTAPCVQGTQRNSEGSPHNSNTTLEAYRTASAAERRRDTQMLMAAYNYDLNLIALDQSSSGGR